MGLIPVFCFMPQFSNIFYEIAAILALAVSAGAIAVWLRQPLIIAFIAVGILLGPSGLDWVSSDDPVNLFAKLGITSLLFVVGLKLDPSEIKAVGPVALVVGVGQIALTSVIGYIFALLLGLSSFAAFYTAIALTFSSTILIIKLLSDKREIDSLHGRIAIGVLIIQDISIIILMIVLSAWSGEGADTNLGQILFSVGLRAIGFLSLIAIFSKFFLPKLLHSLARSPEILVLFAIAWATALAAAADGLGFTKEVGAFLAGVAIASTSYRIPIASRLVSLRDFLLLFFFIDLGVHIDLGILQQQLIPALVLSGFVLIGKPILILGLMGTMGYRKYTSALTSLSLCQISEFSFILAALGVSLGHIDESILGLITLIGLITMGLSSYLIIYSNQIYPLMSRWLTIFERRLSQDDPVQKAEKEDEWIPIDFIVFGLGRYGGTLVRELSRAGYSIIGVDFDPEIVAYWNRQGLRTYYGDADDPELAAQLPLNKTQWVVSSVPRTEVSLVLLHTLEHINFPGRIALTSHHKKDAELLKREGAHKVLLPFRDAAVEASRELIMDSNPKNS